MNIFKEIKRLVLLREVRFLEARIEIFENDLPKYRMILEQKLEDLEKL